MAKTIREQIAGVDAQIAKLNAKRSDLVSKQDSEVDPAHIISGSTVTFSYGKGDTKRELVGVVTGVKPANPAEPKSATMIRVAVGDGFEAQIVTIYAASVTKAVLAAQPNTAPAE
jgi:hypothetical protein